MSLNKETIPESSKFSFVSVLWTIETLSPLPTIDVVFHLVIEIKIQNGFTVRCNHLQIRFFSFLINVKLATSIEGDSKTPFSIVATPGLLHVTLDPYLIMLRRHQVPFFFGLWYDSTWDWTLVARTIGEHSTHLDNNAFLWNLMCTLYLLCIFSILLVCILCIY